MQEIVASIRRVSDIIGEISAASTEQSSGVAQVGQAVTQMDEATQQNAALVEQSAAAAESLRQQAQQLVQAVSVFKLDTHGAAAAKPHHTAYPSAQPVAIERRSGSRVLPPVPKSPASAPVIKPRMEPSAPLQTPELKAPEPKSGGVSDDWESF
jgi:methyl-accepting chemotaxis protein